MTGLVSRSLSLATSAERGDDDRPLGDGEENDVPTELQHEVVLVEHDGPAFDQCVHCRWSTAIGRIDETARCPAREHESAVARRAERALEDDGQTGLGGPA